MEFGLYGLGVMGTSLARNLIGHGFRVSLYSASTDERIQFRAAVPEGCWKVEDSVNDFLQSLERPRKVLLMITAGEPVDSVLKALLPKLDPGDIIMDGGNSHFEDTQRRCLEAEKYGVCFMGVGISGGEKGALTGPCIMVGGDKAAWEKVRPIFESIAATANDGQHCCGYIGSGGAGHYVKMVHNGIEYAIMQQIADAYALMRDGLHMQADEIGAMFSKWKAGPLKSYLIDITAAILQKKDVDGSALIDKVLDVAKQKGTGCWSVIEAARRGVYISCIDQALFVRFLSEDREARMEASRCLPRPNEVPVFRDLEHQLESSLYLGFICAYAQGIALIERASSEQNWNVNLPDTVKLWRGGCIIQSEMLNDLVSALKDSNSKSLLFTGRIAKLNEMESDLREVVIQAVRCAVPIPSLSAALLYCDLYGAQRMSVNLIQAQRDCFGAHTYERIDKPGIFHSKWMEP